MRLPIFITCMHAFLSLAPDSPEDSSSKSSDDTSKVSDGSGGAAAPPPALGETMQNLAKTVEKVVPPADNTAALEAMTAEGIQDSEDAIQAAEGDSLLGRVVNALVDARLNALFLTGMCPRNYTITCPTGWTETVPGLECDNPAMDPASTPPDCQRMYAKQYSSPVLKADFATKCKVQWPCAACTKDFSNCPRQFHQVEEATKGYCKAGHKYLGPCPEAIDFGKFPDNTEKATWATRCYTEWPCSPE